MARLQASCASVDVVLAPLLQYGRRLAVSIVSHDEPSASLKMGTHVSTRIRRDEHGSNGRGRKGQAGASASRMLVIGTDERAGCPQDAAPKPPIPKMTSAAGGFVLRGTRDLGLAFQRYRARRIRKLSARAFSAIDAASAR
jgi:hypothetical protein